MRLKVRGFEVDIKAKEYEERMNKQETMEFLNQLICFIGEAERRYRESGFYALEKSARETREDIYKVLEANGLYKDLPK